MHGIELTLASVMRDVAVGEWLHSSTVSSAAKHRKAEVVLA